ncbi:MAG: AAA family ATPase [Verrucomicrobia bacterium]|nr:AAA family ATPase [Verrucomicrobiota bacterium]
MPDINDPIAQQAAVVPELGGEPALASDDLAAVQKLKEGYRVITEEMAKVIVGQQAVIEELLISLFSRGHCLLVGVPGLAKTLMIRTLSSVLSLSFNRIQFTPDLMPSDITGTDIIQDDVESGGRKFVFLKGPVFANILLADEINRTPPKTQAALLEAMQEHQVTASGRRYKLDEPFFVLATQNPIEQEGTYPLPEAQLDRFMFNVQVGYPTEDEELEIVRTTTSTEPPELTTVLHADDILALQDIIIRTPVPEHVYRYALRLARMTRPLQAEAPEWLRDWVSWGAGPRASQYLILGAKARAILRGRYAALLEDVQAVAPAVLRHRIVTNFNAESEGVTQDEIIARLIKELPKTQEDYKVRV